MLLLNQKDIEQCINMPEAIATMRSVFLQLSKNQVEMPQRMTIQNKNNQSMAFFMPAQLNATHQLGTKIVTFFPNNASKSLPTINGVILLLDTETGAVKALLEASYLTAIRTGAVSGLATELLSDDQARHVAIIGSGAQARTQLSAVCAVRNITHIYIYSRTFANTERLVAEITQNYPQIKNIYACKNVIDACKNADIICTATNATTPIIEQYYLRPHCHINAVGSHSKEMQEISGSVLREAKIIVDHKSAALIEAGEVIHAIENGILAEDKLIELGEIIGGAQNHIPLKNQLTVFKSVGLAIQDVAIAETVLVNALTKKLGTQVQF